jgi:hypothetical protein
MQRRLVAAYGAKCVTSVRLTTRVEPHLHLAGLYSAMLTDFSIRQLWASAGLERIAAGGVVPSFNHREPLTSWQHGL